MAKVEQYSFGCMIGIKDNIELLHIQVKSLKFPDQFYFKHYQYGQLPSSIRLIFKNLAQIFIFLQRKQMIYFDQEQQALKLCLAIAGQVKEFPIPLENNCKSKVVKQKILAYEQEKAKLNYEFSMLKIEKDENLQALKKQTQQLKGQRIAKQGEINGINEKNVELETEIQQMRKQCQDKMALIRQLVPKESQIKFHSVNDYKRHEERKKFWVEEIGKLKKDKFLELKTYINKRVNFQQQVNLSINHLKLTKMLFVEIFINLQVLDLSNNAIVAIEGLNTLRQLLKLKLSQNKITVIPLLPKLQRLLELILNSNLIKKLQNVFHLSNLQILNLSLNKIQVIPDGISRLNRLVQLRLYQNNISVVSEKVLLLKNIKIFSVMRNRCYNEGSKGKDIINKMLKNGIRTAIEEIHEINIIE